jgi:hypothetical protein
MEITKIEELITIKEKFKEKFTQFTDDKLYKYRESQSSNIPDSSIFTFAEILQDTEQPTQDLTKGINSIILMAFYDICKIDTSINIIKKEGKGYDNSIDDLPHEVKVTHAENFVKSWIGNKSSDKVSNIILFSYYLDRKINQITHLFMGIIDLSKCANTVWKKTASNKSQYSILKICIEDSDKMLIIFGDKKEMRKGSKYQYYILEKLKIN